MALPSITVVGLRCRECGEHLAGGDYDRVFVCPSCHRAFEAGGTGLEETPFLEARSAAGGHGAPHLPIWMLDVEITSAMATDAHRERAARFFGKGRIFVAGFRMSHRGYYGDPGISLTRHWYLKVKSGEAPDLVIEKAMGALPHGCQVGSERAMVYAEPVILSVIDPIIDVTGLSLTIAFEKKTLLSTEFTRRGSRLACLDLSDEYPLHAFSGIVFEKAEDK